MKFFSLIRPKLLRRRELRRLKKQVFEDPTPEGVRDLAHRLVWASETEEALRVVVYIETLCYVACEDGSLHALDVSDNLAKLWRTRCGGPITGKMVVTEGMLLVPCHDGRLYAFDDDGKKIQ